MNQIRIKHMIHGLLLLSLIISCNSNKLITSNDDDKVIAIKFMGTITTQPVELNEQIFWSFPEEHVVLKIDKNDDFISRVRALPTNDGETFSLMKYAFLIEQGKKQRDTVYADIDLKTWRFNVNGNPTFHFDANGDILFDLENRYSFFNPCW